MSKHAEYVNAFAEVNERGADRFGTLWIQATLAIVGSLKSEGYGDQLETDYRFRSAVARGMYRALNAATRHPNNLARAREKIAADALAGTAAVGSRERA